MCSYLKGLGYLFSMVVFVAGAVAANEANNAAVISVSTTPLASLFYISDEKGFFSAAGVDVELRPIVGGHRSMRQVLEGKADYGTSSDMVIMNNARSGAQFQVLGTFVASAEDTALIVRGDSGVRTGADLKGKRIGMTPGTSSHYFLDTLLMLSGVSPDEVRQVPVQPEDMLHELESKNIDVASAWEPGISRAVAALGSDVFVLQEIGVYTLTFNLVSTPGKAKTETTEGILSGLIKAEDFCAARQAECKAIVARKLNLETSLVEDLWSHYDFSVRLDQSLVITLESELEWSQMNASKQAEFINFLDYIDIEPLTNIAPSRVRIVK